LWSLWRAFRFIYQKDKGYVLFLISWFCLGLIIIGYFLTHGGIDLFIHLISSIKTAWKINESLYSKIIAVILGILLNGIYIFSFCFSIILLLILPALMLHDMIKEPFLAFFRGKSFLEKITLANGAETWVALRDGWEYFSKKNPEAQEVFIQKFLIPTNKADINIIFAKDEYKTRIEPLYYEDKETFIELIKDAVINHPIYKNWVPQLLGNSVLEIKDLEKKEEEEEEN